MNIELKDIVTNQLIKARILPAKLEDMPLKENGWNFNWRKLFKDGGIFYKVILDNNHMEIEGLIKLTLENQDMVVMNFIEVAPHNYGSNGKYDNVAACLIAFACNLSFELGKNDFKGYVVFDSKTKLIGHYESKYGATRIGGQRMYISPNSGKNLMKQYLKI